MVTFKDVFKVPISHFEIDLRQRFTQKAEDNMGNSNAKVVNDTEESIHLYVFDYADGLRWWPREEFALKPHHTHDVKTLKAPATTPHT